MPIFVFKEISLNNPEIGYCARLQQKNSTNIDDSISLTSTELNTALSMANYPRPPEEQRNEYKKAVAAIEKAKALDTVPDNMKAAITLLIENGYNVKDGHGNGSMFNSVMPVYHCGNWVVISCDPDEGCWYDQSKRYDQAAPTPLEAVQKFLKLKEEG